MSCSVSTESQYGLSLHTSLGAVVRSDARIQHGEWSDRALGANPTPVTLGSSVLETNM